MNNVLLNRKLFQLLFIPIQVLWEGNTEEIITYVCFNDIIDGEGRLH